MKSTQLIVTRLGELGLKITALPSYALDRLEAAVEKDHTKLEAQFHAKLRQRATKLVTVKTVGKAIGDGPMPAKPANAATAAPTQPSSQGGSL